MIQLFDAQAPKKPANLSINSDLLAKARALNINLSATLAQKERQSDLSLLPFCRGAGCIQR